MDAAALEDLFAPVCPVRVKRMFGVFDGETMFALAFDGEIFLKTSSATQECFVAAGSTPFVYRHRSRERDLGYWPLPEAALDDSDELARWTALALEAARERAGLKRRGSSSRKRPR